MSGRSSAALYSPKLLALAVELADFPFDPDAPHKGKSSSRACGSRVELSCLTDASGALQNIGVRVTACAIGQAAVAIFACSASGRGASELEAFERALRAWLGGEGGQPDWPGIDALAPALDHPGRHEAILLPWKAARAALCKHAARG